VGCRSSDLLILNLKMIFFLKTGEPKHKVLAPSGRQCIASVIKVKGDRKKCCFGLTLKILARIDDLPGRDLEVC
jgi:hypothetical protein